MAHGGDRNLQPVHAEQVPEKPPQPHLPICKSEVLVHRAKLIDLCNHRDNVHTAVVEVQEPIPLPLPSVWDSIMGSRPRGLQAYGLDIIIYIYTTSYISILHHT